MSQRCVTKQGASFVWTTLCHEAFDTLKDRLVSSPVLAYPCFTKPFVLHTDASGVGLGAVLEQGQEDGKLHPISYASRTLSKHESRYGITDLEALGVVWACKHYRAYLLGHRCVVYTDHAPLKAMLKAKHPSGRLARWAGVISELDTEIQYRPGKKHSNANALSRSQVEHGVAEGEVEAEGVVAQVATVEGVTSVRMETEELVKLQKEDEDLMEIRRFLVDGSLPEDTERTKHLVLRRNGLW